MPHLNPPLAEPSREQDDFMYELSLQHEGQSVCVGRIDTLTGNMSYTLGLHEWIVDQGGRVVQERVNASVRWNREA